MSVRSPSPIAKALFAYVALIALVPVVVLLPGGSASFSSHRAVVSAIIYVLIVWGLARGSALAWAVGLLFALLGVAVLPLAASPSDWKVIAVFAVSLAQAALLVSRPLRFGVWSGLPRR